MFMTRGESRAGREGEGREKGAPVQYDFTLIKAHLQYSCMYLYLKKIASSPQCLPHSNSALKSCPECRCCHQS